jgi:hypothetical protein
MRVQGIDPVDFLRRLGGLDIQIDDDGILTAADEDATENFGLARVALLMGHERRNENEIAGPRLRDKLQLLAPAHTRPAVDDVDNAFQLAMMVRAGFGVGIDPDRACPKFAGPGADMGDRSGSRHPGRLRRIEIELRARNDFDSVLAPIWL